MMQKDYNLGKARQDKCEILKKSYLFLEKHKKWL